MKYHVLQNCAFMLEVIRLIYCSVWLLSPAKVDSNSLKDVKNTVEELRSFVQALSYKLSLTSE